MVINLENLTQENIESVIQKILEDKKSKFMYTFNSNSENDTLMLGYILAKYMNSSTIITLSGELGSGKTVLVKGIGKYFNILNDISSPTFTIVNEYDTPDFPIYHFDLYRLNDMYNFLDTIGTDYFSKGPCIIEWGEIIEEILPRNTIHIEFKKEDKDVRKIKIWR